MTKSIRAKKSFGLLSASVLALMGWASPISAAQEQVDLKLVLATDVSGSINDEEFRLEREGTAEAFSSPEVVKAIQSGALGRIAVAMLDFSSPEYDKVVIGWRIIHDDASAAAFAETIRDTPRSPGRRTSVSSALELGALLLETSEKDIVGTRRVIDVSGDGPNNDGNALTEAHDKTIAQGIIVNGLPVMDDQANGYYPNLDKYYAACVAGGRGSFVVVVHSYRDYSAAMRRKLILEISQNETQIKQARNDLLKNRFLLKIAESPSVAPSPQVLRPGRNEFSNRCDINGGYGGFGGFR